MHGQRYSVVHCQTAKGHWVVVSFYTLPPCNGAVGSTILQLIVTLLPRDKVCKTRDKVCKTVVFYRTLSLCRLQWSVHWFGLPRSRSRCAVGSGIHLCTTKLQQGEGSGIVLPAATLQGCNGQQYPLGDCNIGGEVCSGTLRRTTTLGPAMGSGIL